MLLAIRDLLQERRRATLTDVALHFGRDPEAVRGMVGHWIGKGLVRRLDDEGCVCTGCSKCCSGMEVEIFEWIGPEPTHRTA